jgi:hypothetical protein
VAVAVVADDVAEHVTDHGDRTMKKILSRSTLALAVSLAAFGLAPAAAQAPSKPAAATAAKASPAAQRTFASAEEAAKALVETLRAGDMKGVAAIIGPGSQGWIGSGDAVQDKEDLRRFLAAYDEKNALEAKDAGSFILAIGADAFPFAVPIVKNGGKWAFDARAGREEVANRRVGRNELDTIRTLRELVEAQRVYRTTDPDRDGVAGYARRIISSKGKKDGLYWPASPAEPASPLEALAALASAHGYATKASASPQPFRGYLYRMLTDKAASSFTVVAYPVKYGVSGIMTFAVNQDGAIHEKDLGSGTAALAAGITRYKPDKSWRKSGL